LFINKNYNKNKKRKILKLKQIYSIRNIKKNM